MEFDQEGSEGSPKKWVPRPLVTVCGVCSAPATDVQHYGSISCYSCRAFFRRSVGGGKGYEVCSRGTDDCSIDPVNRTNCKRCRFNKSIKVGMRPEKVDRNTRKKESVRKEKTSLKSEEPRTQQSSDFDMDKLVDDCFADEMVMSIDVEDPNLSPSYQPQPPLEDPNLSPSIQPRSTLEDLNHHLSFQLQPALEDPNLYPFLQPQPAEPIPVQIHLQEAMDIFAPHRRVSEDIFSPPPGVSKEMFPVPPEVSKNIFPLPPGFSDNLFAPPHEVANVVFSPPPVEFPTTVFIVSAGIYENVFTPSPEVCENLFAPPTPEFSVDVIAQPHAIPPSIDTVDLTFEEEFRIHELIVRKENSLSQFFHAFRRVPSFKSKFQEFLQSINEQGNTPICPPPLDKIMLMPVDFWLRVSQSTQGYFSFVDDIFDGSIDLQTRVETLTFTLPVVQICIRALLLANMDKQYFLRQHAGAGTLNQGLIAAYSDVFPFLIENKEMLVRSFDPLNFDMFTSPWASSWQDELKFTETVLSVGNLLKDDNKLSTLYFFLVLLTPASSASQMHPDLARVRRELILLLYRYLKSRTGGDSSIANTILHHLIRLLSDLHECREIHINRRIYSLRPAYLLPDVQELIRNLETQRI